MTSAKSVAARCLDFAATLNTVTALQTDRTARDVSGQFFIEGVRNVVRAVEHRFHVDRIIYSERLLIAPIARQLMRRCRRAGVATENITPEQFRQISYHPRASGIAAIVQQRWTSIADASPAQGLAWTVLETVRSPGNLGTLIRSSQAVGGAGFILLGNRVDPYGPEVVRASMGALYGQNLVRADWDGLRRWISRHKIQVFGATPDGATDLHNQAFHGAPLLMLGEERKGLTRRQAGVCTHLVRIPMEKGTDSLNVGVAGSLLLYEVYRARRQALPQITS